MPYNNSDPNFCQDYDRHFRSSDQMRWARLERNADRALTDAKGRPDKVNRKRPAFEYEFFNYEVLNPTRDGNNRAVYPVALYTNWR